MAAVITPVRTVRTEAVRTVSIGALIVSGLVGGVLGTSSFAQAPPRAPAARAAAPAAAPSATTPSATPAKGEWRTYGGDLTSARYSPLDQITSANFNSLEVAWRFKTDNLGPNPEFNFQSTPLMVGGVLYTTAGSRRAVVAIDAATGETLWVHREPEGERAEKAPRKLSGRGLAYWTDGRVERIVYVTIGYEMVALDAKTGQRVPTFGKNGMVDLKLEDDQDMDPVLGDIGLHAAPIISKDVIVIGAAHTEGSRRPGNGLYGESLVALDVKTGKRKWHYQFIKHGIWDWDLPCAGILADVRIDGRMRKIIAQPTKQGWVYVFDRATGEPIWPFEERKVEASNVPGESSNPTQLFVVKPPPFERQGVSPDDLIDFTPALKAEGLKLASRFKLGPIFTPPVVSKWDGPLATLMLPNVTGGANWQGGSYDPETGIFYIFSNAGISDLGLVPGGEQSDMAFVRGQASNPTNAKAPPVPLTVQGLPLVKPPYGRITAIDLNKGDLVWQVAHGETPDNVRNHPALKGLTIPRTGRQGRIGTLVTKSLLIAGEGGTFTLPDGRRGAMLRAYDKATGKDAGAVYMPAPQTGSPMTYLLGGRQYVVVAISGPNFPGELIAYRLPME